MYETPVRDRPVDYTVLRSCRSKHHLITSFLLVGDIPKLGTTPKCITSAGLVLQAPLLRLEHQASLQRLNDWEENWKAQDS